MNTSEIIEALELPERSSIDRRVPKKLLQENGAPTAADKRFINEGIEELLWVAALKPNTIAVPGFHDDVREYLEIEILRLTVRPRGKAFRLAELIHRAVPYPVVLLTDGESSGMSLAHKRRSLNEAGTVVLDGEIVWIEWDEATDGPYEATFRDTLRLSRQPHGSLHALYQGWMNTMQALAAARLTGTFQMPASGERATMRRGALKECSRLGSDMMRLRSSAAKEKQIARQVELNLELKRVEAAFAAARAEL